MNIFFSNTSDSSHGRSWKHQPSPYAASIWQSYGHCFIQELHILHIASNTPDHGSATNFPSKLHPCHIQCPTHRQHTMPNVQMHIFRCPIRGCRDRFHPRNPHQHTRNPGAIFPSGPLYKPCTSCPCQATKGGAAESCEEGAPVIGVAPPRPIGADRKACGGVSRDPVDADANGRQLQAERVKKHIAFSRAR